MATFVWNGDRIRDQIAAATLLAVDETMAACVEHAKANHPAYPPSSDPGERYANRTAFLTDSIQILEGAAEDGERIGGRWGSDARYALYLEIGTSITGPRAEQRAEMGQGDIHDVPPPVGPLMAPRPYLRPAMDVEYPLLAWRIARAWGGGAP